MKIAFYGIEDVFECDGETRWTVVVENQKKFSEILMDIVAQLEGNEGRTVLSKDNSLLRMDKNLELLSQFLPFDINRKSLLTKITARMQEMAVGEDFYLQTQELLGEWEKFCLDLSVQLVGDFNFTKISVESLLKSAGVEIEGSYERLGEKILDYMELVNAYEGTKVFVFVNLRSFIDDVEMKVFLEEVIKRNYEAIFIESSEHPIISGEKRYIIDADLCNIC